MSLHNIFTKEKNFHKRPGIPSPLNARALFPFLAVLLLSSLVFTGLAGCERSEEEETGGFLSASKEREQLKLWYSDESLTEYLEAAAFSYTEIDDSVRVVPELVSGTEFLDTLYKASLEEDAPDMYLLSNDQLEKAYLAGLADPIIPKVSESHGIAEPIPDEGVVALSNFPQAAIWAVSYNGRRVGYPFYLQTSAFLYNKTYLDEMGESAPPATIQEIEEFANLHDAPEGMESFFTWDVTDIFYNYFFIGGVIDMGGECGDDMERIDLVNPKAIQALQLYQGLNQFFSIDSSEVSYSGLMEEFKEGKILFTVVTSNAVSELAQAKENGELQFEYMFAPLPDIEEGIPGRSLSVTEAVCVNGFSTSKEKAHEFASYLTTSYSENLYARTGKIPAYRESAKQIQGMEAFLEEYEFSAPIPKMIETGALWVRLEIALTKIWEGGDVEEELRALGL
ncbi:MAG: extracellular solute-binding protein [Lachnospiraceae bacterium]|nr:extracellular solute-binding protein [Lachnospiraceae bacterium]